MATLVLKQPQASVAEVERSLRYNMNAFASLILAGIFILYFCVPHSGIFGSIFHLSVLYLVIVPLAAFILAVTGLRQINRNHDRGTVFGVIALFVTSLYLIVALATPIVLLGFYVVYAYILP